MVFGKCSLNVQKFSKLFTRSYLFQETFVALHVVTVSM